jgi:hypothetical protein
MGAEFSEKQIGQLEKLLDGLSAKLENRFDHVESKLDRVDRELESVWELLLRKEIQKQYGEAFAKDVTINSLQNVLKCATCSHR